MSQNKSDRSAPVPLVEDTHAKRAALAGQWRTPPHPIFPAGHPHAVAAAAAATAAMNQPPPPTRGGHPPNQQHPGAGVHPADATTGAPMQQSHAGIPPPHSHTQPPPPHATHSHSHYATHAPGGGLPVPHGHTSMIPDNSEDYAKALQEAYRKGAEAAARMAQQQQHQQPHGPPPPQQQPIQTAASCPNFQTGQQIAPPPPHASTGGIAAEEAAYSHQVHPTPSTAHSSNGRPDPLSSSMPPPPPQHGGHPPPQQASAHPQHGGPPPHSQHMQPPPPPHHHSGYAHHPHPPPTSAAATAKPPPPTSAAPPPPPQSKTGAAAAAQGRSLSLPDMSAYAAQAEEEKRQKRLARNRASARLRRLRKKNLVDAYETEVGILEKTLKQLQAHEWGQADNHTALLDALGMERGQQAIPPEQRTEIIQDILKQQMQHVELLRQAQMEQECLSLLVDNPDDELSKELQSILQLNDTQKANIKTSSKCLDSEVEALETVASSLEAMLENKWLLNEGVQNITDQFTSILHKNQLSKFLLWTDANVESIDQLDHVQVQPLQGAPIFSFGVESTPGDDEEK